MRAGHLPVVTSYARTMNPVIRYHRLPAAILASLGITLLALVVGAPATAAPKASISMADAFLVESTGGWFCPSVKVKCLDGKAGTSQGFAESLLAPGALKAAGPRLYLRAAKARNDCKKGNEHCANLGVPAREPCQPGATNTPFCALLSLKQAKVKLGIVISAKRDAPKHEDPDESDESDKGRPRTPSALAWHACEIRKADVANLYDFIFMDFTFKMKPPQVRKAVTMMKRGEIIDNGKRVKCRAGGWPRVMTNDTTWHHKNHNYNLNTGAWAHAKRLGLIERDKPATAAGSGLTPNDRAFVERVHAAGSRPVLRLEVTPDTSEFAGLERPVQCSLLTTWALGQRKFDYTLLFPLFVHGVTARMTDPYNSIVAQTFPLQMELIADPSTAPKSGCPANQLASGSSGQPAEPTTAPVGATPPQTAPPAARMPDVLAHEPTNVSCHSARLNGWVNPHGSATRFHFQYWKRGEPAAALGSGDGDAGAGTARVEIARVVDGLTRNTGYTGARRVQRRRASPLGIFSFTTPGC